MIQILVHDCMYLYLHDTNEYAADFCVFYKVQGYFQNIGGRCTEMARRVGRLCGGAKFCTFQSHGIESVGRTRGRLRLVTTRRRRCQATNTRSTAGEITIRRKEHWRHRIRGMPMEQNSCLHAPFLCRLFLGFQALL